MFRSKAYDKRVCFSTIMSKRRSHVELMSRERRPNEALYHRPVERRTIRRPFKRWRKTIETTTE